MRTTLSIDDDLLVALKEVAKRESKSVGAVASALLRQSLSAEPGDDREGTTAPLAEFGFRPFPKRGGIVTNALIDRLREEGDD